MLRAWWTATAAVAWLSGSALGAETAAEVLTKVREAVGYARVAAHPAGIQATGKANFAGTEAQYSLLFAGDASSIQSLVGPITTVAAVDGESVWITDIGGETRAVSGADRENNLLGLSMLSYSYLGEWSPLDFTLDEGESGEQEVALEFQVRGGRVSGTLLVSRAKWLPMKWTYTLGAATSKVELGDYREFDGLKLPGKMVTKTASGMETRSSITSIAEAPTFVRSPYEMVGGVPADTHFDASVSPVLDVVKSPTGHILVHPLVNGKDVGWFIFDTGAGANVISTPVIGELGLEAFGEVSAKGVGGDSSAVFCRPATLSLGPVTIEEPLMVGIDLSFLEQHMGRKIAGLVGYNLLARVTAKVDMVTPAIEIHDPARFDDAGVRWEDLVIDQRLPHVRAKFEGHEGLFRLDTGVGSGTVSMHEPAVRELKLLEGRETKEGKAGGVGGFVAVRSGELAWIEIAGKRMEKMEADFATEAKGAFADPWALGNIGGGLLRSWVLVMDYTKGRIGFIERAAGE